MNFDQVNSTQADTQSTRPLASKIFSWLLIISTTIIAFVWATLLFYRNTPVLETPHFVNGLNILWLPLATIIYLYFIGPVCLILSTLFKSHTLPPVETSKKERLVIGASASAFGLLFLYGTISSFNIYREDIFLIPNLLAYIVLGVIVIITAGLLWFAVALGQRHRWSMPLALFLGTGISIASFLELLHRLTPPVDELGMIALSAVFTLFFTGLTIVIYRYRHLFSGHPRKLWLQIPLLIILCGQIGFALQTQLYLDDFSMQDSDLLLPAATPLTVEENAYSFIPTTDSMSDEELASMEQALDYFRSLDKAPDVTKSASSSLIINEAKFAATGTKALVYAFIEASSKKGYQCPTSLNQFNYDTKLCALNIIRDLANLTSLHSYIATLEGDNERAVELSFAILEMGKLMSETEHPPLIEYLVSRALLGIGVSSLHVWLDHTTNPSTDLLERVIDSLPNYTLEPSTIVRAYSTEYMTLRTSLLTNPNHSLELDLSEELFLFKGKANYAYLPNQTTNTAGNFYRSYIALAESACTMDISYQEEIVDAEIQFASAEYMTGPLKVNLVGRTLLAVYLASFNDVRNSQCEYNEEIKKLLERLQNS